MITKLEKYKNFNHFQSLLVEFDALELKIGEYAIFGSGPLAVRGIVYANDIDVIVREDCWRFGYIKKFGTKRIGNVELSIDWPGFDEINKLIDDCDIIEGRNYVKIEYVLEYKNKLNREKDLDVLNLFNKNQIKTTLK